MKETKTKKPASKTKKPDTKKKPDPKNEGQRLFIALGGGEADLAKKIGCGQAVVGHWRRGRRLPSEAYRDKIEFLFDIPRRAWDVEPGAPLPDSMPTTTPKSDADDDTLSIVKSQINEVREALNNKKLTDNATAKLRDTLAKLLALRARLERDQEMLEDRAVREHPEWLKTKATILKALEPYTEALSAVAEALKS